MSYPSLKILIANSICNVALSRFPHRQVSVVIDSRYHNESVKLSWLSNMAVEQGMTQVV